MRRDLDLIATDCNQYKSVKETRVQETHQATVINGVCDFLQKNNTSTSEIIENHLMLMQKKCGASLRVDSVQIH